MRTQRLILPVQQPALFGGKPNLFQMLLAAGLSAADLAGVYVATGRPSLAVSYVNLASPGTHNLAPSAVNGSIPCLGAEGWATDGVAKVLNTTILITNVYSAFLQFKNCTSAGYLIGEYSVGTNGFAIGPTRGAPGVRYYWGGDAGNIGANLVSGNVGIVGTYAGVANHWAGFRNGSLDNLFATGGWAGGAVTDTFCIGARAVGGPDTPARAICQALVMVSRAVTAPEALAIRNAMVTATACAAPIYYSMIGTSISSYNGNYFQQLVLAAGGRQGYNHALPGATIVANMAAQVTAAASDTASKIIVEMGTNDGASDPATVRATYATQLEALHASNAGAAIYALKPFATLSAPIHAAIADGAADAVAAGSPVTFVDTTGWIDLGTDTVDGTHPNAGGYTKILNALTALL